MATLSCAQLVDARGTKLSISHDDLRQLFGTVEAEFCQSDIYKRALTGLQQRLGGASEGVQALIRSLGREAIRLALRQVVRQYQDVPGTPSMPAAHTLAATSMSAAGAATAEPLVPPSSLRPTVSEMRPSAALTPLLVGPSPGDQPDSAYNTLSGERGDRPSTSLPASDPSPLAPAAIATEDVSPGQPASPVSPLSQETSPPTTSRGFWGRAMGGRVPSGQAQTGGDRESMLRQIGAELHQARQSLSLSIEQVHYRTHVPLHLVKALEAGRLDQLPEDVYVRGFIQRLGDALSLEGASLASRIPLPDTSKTVLPSWQKSSRPATAPSYLRPAHLYVGYAALMAGAVGGLFWMTWQPSLEGPGGIRLPQLFNQGLPDLREMDWRPQTTETHSRSVVDANGLNANRGGINWAIARPELAPLETVSLETSLPMSNSPYRIERTPG
ncbi:MAG: helix-turn-helix domain-containing protein [Synechococcales bacterium]|nr:helix-turn-helix domain-containing protein [Synechococcales bacterium]